MREIIAKVIAYAVAFLDRNKDKVYHYALGTALAYAFVVAFIALGKGASVCISVALLMGIECYKEFVLDGEADWRDIVATALGGLVVWVSVLM